MDSIIPQPQEQLPVDSTNSPQVPEQKHFLNKKFIVTFVVLAVLGSGAYAGIWYWQNQQLTNEVVPTFTPRPIDETANWKTYHNDQYGFEVKYPIDWFEKDITYDPNDDVKFNGQIIMLDTQPIIHNREAMHLPSRGLIIRTEKYTNQDTTCSKESLKIETVVIDGTSLQRCKTDFGSSYTIYAIKNGMYYSFSYQYINPEIKSIDQILATFKFTK